MAPPERRPLRVVQWTTGNVARQAVRAIAERPELEIVGVYAFSQEKINLRVEILPQDFETMPFEEMLAIGSVITAMPVVNAIPDVVAARPGIVTYAGLTAQASRLMPQVR